MTKLDTTAPHPNAHREGVRPMHAACERCGYEFAGVSIRNGVITCPECGHINPFELPPVDRRPLIFLRIARIAFLTLAALALLALLLWMTGAAALLKSSSPVH